VHNCIQSEEAECEEFPYSGSTFFSTSATFPGPYNVDDCKWCYVSISDISGMTCGSCTDDCADNTCYNSLIAVDTPCVEF